MVSERIDILVNSRGERVVKRKLDSIGDSARRSSQHIRNLQNALFVLGGAGILRAIGRASDTLTNFENRLRLVTKSERELEAVSDQLFRVAAETRTEFGLTGEIFTRFALNTRNLGLSQMELINITETLNKATILSGASAREANAALIQLSQGLASNRLSGDELRSVLEQLPLVADIIAKQLGITRGELRKFGREGKITAATVVEAFQGAREEIAEKFAKTIPTLEQSFTVLGVKALELLDAFDDSTGTSEKLARAIIAIADNLDIIAVAATAAATALALIGARRLLAGPLAFARSLTDLRRAVAAGNATLLTSIGIEKAKAASSLAAASAQAAETNSTVISTAADVRQLQAQRALLIQQQQSLVLDARRRVARDALTGRFVAYNAAVAQNVRTNIALSKTETLLAAARGRLTTATAAQIAAENTLTAAQTRSTAATAAKLGFLGRLGERFPVLSAAVTTATGTFSRFGAVLAKNPLGAIITAIIAVVAGLATFGNAIKVTEDGVVGMGHVVQAVFQLIGEAVKPVTDFIAKAFTFAWNQTKKVWSAALVTFSAIASGILNVMAFVPRVIAAVFIAGYKTLIATWSLLPEAMNQVGTLAANALISAFEFAINKIIEGVQGIFGAIDAIAESLGIGTLIGDVFEEVSLDEYKGEVKGAALDVSNTFRNEFNKAFEATSLDGFGELIENTFNGVSDLVLERAREIAEAGGEVDLTEKGPKAPGAGAGAGGGKGKGKKRKGFAGIIDELIQENELLKVNSREREILAKILDIENELKRELTTTEEALVRALLEENKVLQKAAEIMDSFEEPIADYKDGLAALNMLLKEGKINQDQFNLALGQMEIPTALRELDQELLGTRFAYEGLIADIQQKEAEQLEVVRQALEARIIMEEEAAERIAAIRSNTEQKILNVQLQSLSNQLSATESAFDSLLTFAKDYAGEQSGIYKGIFIAKQAFSVASAIVNTAQAVTEALASGPPPFNYIQAAAVGAAGAAQVATIIGQTISAFADGGEVRGMGGRRQDRELIAASPGEFIINAQQAQRHKGLLRMINNGELTAGATPSQLRNLLPFQTLDRDRGDEQSRRSGAGSSSSTPGQGRQFTLIQNIQTENAETFGRSQRQNARQSRRAFEDAR